MSFEIEPNEYIMRMWSEVKAKELCEYKVYAYSSDEAFQKLQNGEFESCVTPIDIEVISHQNDMPETIEIMSY